MRMIDLALHLSFHFHKRHYCTSLIAPAIIHSLDNSSSGNFSNGYLFQGPFVAAFAQSNEGDVSPNTRGPHCINSGRPCDIITSTCDGKVIPEWC